MGFDMPPKTKKQQRFMKLCTTPKGRAKAKGKCPPIRAAKKFSGKVKKL